MSSNPDLRCGPLVRRGDGTWWYENTPLGLDDVPFIASETFHHSLAMVCVRLFLALDRVTEELRSAGRPHLESEEVLAQYERWRVTQMWPKLPESIRPAFRAAEGRDLVRAARTIFEDVFRLLRSPDLIEVLTKSEAWVERAERLIPKESPWT